MTTTRLTALTLDGGEIVVVTETEAGR